MKHILDKFMNMGLQEGELFYLNSIKEEIGFENNKLKTVNTSQNSGVALRAVKDGKLGYVTSSNLDDVDSMIENLIKVAQYSPQKQFDFSKNQKFQEKKYSNNRVGDMSIEKLMEDGHKAIDIIRRYDDNVLVSLDFSKEEQEVTLVNTNDVNVSYKKDIFSVYMSGNLIKGTSFIGEGVGQKNTYGKCDIEEMAENIIEKISMAKQEASFMPGNKTVIFTPKALTEVFLTLQEGVNGGAIARKISPLCNKLGEKIISDKITIFDDGTMEDGASSMPFDDEGTPAQRTLLVKNGVLNSYLHSLRTATQVGQDPTGNGLRTQNLFHYKIHDIPPRADITNWIIEGGNVKYEDMVADITDGIIIDDIIGIFMNNLINGDFAGNIGMGYVIKNGKIAGRVKEAAINANIYDVFLNNVVALSDRNYNCSLFGNIGTHKMPYIMLKDINIAGKK